MSAYPPHPAAPDADPAHLLIAYAAPHSADGAAALQALALPYLTRLLSGLTPQPPVQHIDCDADEYTPVHERVLAQALGLAVESPPWAAWHSRCLGQPCAYLTPCHWQASMDSVHMHAPENLALDEAQSRALLGSIAPWLAQDGITVDYETPLRWRAQGMVFKGLRTAALECVQGRDVRHWMAQGPQQQLLQRLHSEVQMLLYDHPTNEARSSARLQPVNAFWVHGAGELDALPTVDTPAPTVVLDLRAGALAGDWDAWARAWQQLDAGPLAALAAQEAAGKPVGLTLCGAQSSRHWHSAARSWGQQISSTFKGVFRPQGLQGLRELL